MNDEKECPKCGAVAKLLEVHVKDDEKRVKVAVWVLGPILGFLALTVLADTNRIVKLETIISCIVASAQPSVCAGATGLIPIAPEPLR
jgi:dissimilatory sulfite reductase (desulfoviridin) alpha/beta subunit